MESEEFGLVLGEKLLGLEALNYGSLFFLRFI